LRFGGDEGMYEMVELGTLISQAKTVRCGDAEYPILSMTMRDGLVFQDNKFKKIVASKDKSDYKVVYRNQLVISFPIDEGVLAAQRIADAGIVSPAYGVWNIDQEKIQPEYLEYALRCNRAIGYYKANLRGSTARRRSLPTPTLLAFTVPLPTIAEQNRIINIIHEAKNILDNRKEMLSKLDELIRARFVEMFGTLHDNENGFDVVTINDVCTMIKDGTHQTPQYTENKIDGYKFLSSKDVMSQKIDWTDIKYIPVELHEKLYATIKPQRNDILMSKNGVNYGVAAVNDTDEVFDIYVSLALLRPKKVIDPVFFRCVINNPETKRQFDSSIKGIGVPNLHLGEIKKTRIILPPMELQREFVAFVEQVDKSKLVEATTIIPKGGFLQWR
jgi:type I restriction enzyme S subunit